MMLTEHTCWLQAQRSLEHGCRLFPSQPCDCRLTIDFIWAAHCVVPPPMSEFWRGGGCHGQAWAYLYWWSNRRYYRYAAMNDIIHRALISAGLLARCEPTGLLHAVMASDQMVFQWWRSGKFLVWDATCVDTYAPSYRNLPGLFKLQELLQRELYP